MTIGYVGKGIRALKMAILAASPALEDAAYLLQNGYKPGFSGSSGGSCNSSSHSGNSSHSASSVAGESYNKA